jgi:predicted Zn-dependent protease
LADLAMRWGWKLEAEELWWKVANGHTNAVPALQILYREYKRKGDTKGMYRVTTQLLERHPSDAFVQNNFIQLSLLLNEKIEEVSTMAKTLYEKDDSTLFASTYSFALWKKGAYSEALAILEKLKPEELRNPAISVYYGLCLSSLGSTEKAKQHFQFAEKGILLPEEKALLQEAQRKLKAN